MQQKTIQQDKLIAKGLAKFDATLKRVDKDPQASLTPSKIGKIRDRLKLISDNFTEHGELGKDETTSKKKSQRKPPQNGMVARQSGRHRR